ncbi:MAG: argininosuccinate lyase [Vulcanimicrobiaceae bacterium]
MSDAGVAQHLQWGGRFAQPPDPRLLAFGASLEDDLPLAPFDVRCSHAHVTAQLGGSLITKEQASALYGALDRIAEEIARDTFADHARRGGYEDIHGAIDARVRELVPAATGEALHAGRSRNDQVATTLVLYARDRAQRAARSCIAIARRFLDLASPALEQETVLAGTTHWQPAQPILLAFWLHAASEPFARAARRFARVAQDARASCPLGSGALAGSSLPLDRAAAARELGFDAPSRNALDSVGDRDVALDLLDAIARALLAASRPCEELIVWSTPAFGYARLDDAASTGSSLMPQKRNPDPFELIRAAAARGVGTLSAALGTLKGVALSYHKDLQETKALVLDGTERGLSVLAAFETSLSYLHFDADRMNGDAARGFTVATDVADALIARGMTARAAHRTVGEAVAAARDDGFTHEELERVRAAAGDSKLDVPLDAGASVKAKKTSGSTAPAAVAAAIASSRDELGALERELP